MQYQFVIITLVGELSLTLASAGAYRSTEQKLVIRDGD